MRAYEKTSTAPTIAEQEIPTDRQNKRKWHEDNPPAKKNKFERNLYPLSTLS
jgi:hypothetical protein